MYRTQFFQALRAYLVEVCKMQNVRYYNGDDYIVVADCYFNAHNRRGGRSWTFCGKVFNSKSSMLVVTQALLEELPKQLEIERQRKEESKRYEEARDISRCLYGTGLSIYSNGPDYTMSFRHKDKATLLAAMDCLQDSGFTDANAPQTDDADFAVKQLNRLWNMMTAEQQDEFIQSKVMQESQEYQQSEELVSD